MSEIRYSPTDGLTYNPNEAKYWDPAALQKELERAFDLCNGCRLCFKYCGSFPTLFEAVERVGDVRKLPPEVTDSVIDQCFQCKLCYTQCPYTVAEGHEFKLDVPRLLLRANAIRRRQHGIPLRERMLADPDRLGRVGTLLPRLSNAANHHRANRVVMEKVLGIHRDKLLPDFAAEPFPTWVDRELRVTGAGEAGTHKVLLFSTCFVNWNNPRIGQAAVRVLRHNDCRVACPTLGCCGMPSLDGGDVDAARRAARANVTALAPWVADGYTIAVVNPTCSLMMRQEYPELLDDPADRATHAAAGQVAGATRDLMEFLFELRQAGQFKEDFRTTPAGPVACHAPCHLRIQKIGFRGRDLLRRIPGVQPRLVAECCGHDGTWAMKTEHFDRALRNGGKAFDGMRDAEAGVWTTECPLAAVQFRQACGREALHPIEVLDRAYRPDGFPTKVEPKPTEPAQA